MLASLAMPLTLQLMRINHLTVLNQIIAKHAKVDLIWVAGRSPALVPQNFEMTTLHYLAIGSLYLSKRVTGWHSNRMEAEKMGLSPCPFNHCYSQLLVDELIPDKYVGSLGDSPYSQWDWPGNLSLLGIGIVLLFLGIWDKKYILIHKYWILQQHFTCSGVERPDGANGQNTSALDLIQMIKEYHLR